MADEIQSVLPPTAQMWRDGNVLLLMPARVGWPMRIIVTDDVVRVITGTASRIPVGADEPTDTSVVLNIVRAIIAGDVEEYFGVGDEGPLSVIGCYVWHSQGSLRALGEGVEPVVTYRAPAWED